MNAETTNLVIWCDFACIDQDDRDMQRKGIASLISYAAQSDVVITPVQSEPLAMEAFSTATHPADLHDYGERAWCRLETYMFMCVGEMLMRPIHLFGCGMAIPEPGGGTLWNCFQPKELVPVSRDRSKPVNSTEALSVKDFASFLHLTSLNSNALT